MQLVQHWCNTGAATGAATGATGARLRLRAAATGYGLRAWAAYSLFNRLWDLIRKELEDDSAAVTGVRRRG